MAVPFSCREVCKVILVWSLCHKGTVLVFFFTKREPFSKTVEALVRLQIMFMGTGISSWYECFQSP